MHRGKRLKKSRTVTQRTTQVELRRAKAGAKAGSRAAKTAVPASGKGLQLARHNATLATRRTVAKGQQAAANVQDAIEGAVESVDAMSWPLAKDLLAGVSHAVDMWKLQARFRDIRVNAITALGTPGCLTGPDLESYIASAPTTIGMTGSRAELRDAVAEGVSDCFAQWEDHVTVPGLPWYPAFAAWPGPQAPPTPNVPTPLVTAPSSKLSKITSPGELHGSMLDATPDALRTADVEQGLQKIANALALAFTTWLPKAMIMQVMGKGPVPSFAPPFVPVGPVVMGDVIPTPGHLASAQGLQVILPPTLW